jgi:superfamily II DNA or RNA helicase
MTTPITLRVQDSTTFVVGKMTKELYQEFKKTLGYEDPNRMWKGKNAKNWNGYITTVCYDKARCRCSIKKDGVHFPTGLYSRATDFFRAYGVGCSTSDERSGFSSNQVILGTNHDFQVRDYQQEVIDKAVKQQRGIIKVATGGGKTAIGAGIIAKLGVGPFIFYVTSQDLLRQAKSELERFLNISGMPLEVGVIGGGKCDIRDINIMTIQTAVRAVGEKFKKYDDEDAEKEEPSEEVKARYALIADLIHRAKGMICDEVQHWAAETCQVIADHSMNARFRYGLSATPWRDMGDDLLIDACFGKMIAEINASFLIRQGILVRPTIYFVHTRKKLDEDITYQTAYKEGIVQNEERNLLIANIAQNMVQEGRHVLILGKHIEHGELLESMIPNSVFLNGSHSAKVRQLHIDQMRIKKAPITIATSIFDEGVDVKPLDGLILAGSGKSQTRALQRVGRVIRTFSDPISGFVKKDAYIVDFQDNMKYMQGHSKARRRIYETEPEFIIKDFKGSSVHA